MRENIERATSCLHPRFVVGHFVHLDEMLTENCVLRHESPTKGANMGHSNIIGPVLALEVPLEVALVVEGVVAMRTLVEFLLMSCNMPFEQRLAGSLFSTMWAFEEGFCLRFSFRLFRHFHFIVAAFRLCDGRFTVIVLIRHRVVNQLTSDKFEIVSIMMDPNLLVH